MIEIVDKKIMGWYTSTIPLPLHHIKGSYSFVVNLLLGRNEIFTYCGTNDPQ